MMRILLTGGAGFIGFHATKALLAAGHEVVALDDLNSYYDPALKLARLAQLEGRKGYRFAKADIADAEAITAGAGGQRYDAILHMAAQAGVRYAAQNPAAYTRSNLVGHHNMLEFARGCEGLGQFVYASSSSVYGNDTKAPFSEDARADRPVSYYAATKRAGELLSHSYAELFGLKQTGLRFFTVYGPWGRPDMAYWIFTDAILRGKSLPLFGGGKLKRDYTYVDDIVTALVRIVETPFASAEVAPHRVYNLGNSHPEETLDLVRAIERATERKAIIENAQGPLGDVSETYANISRAARDFGFAPQTRLGEGIPRFVDWFKSYFKL